MYRLMLLDQFSKTILKNNNKNSTHTYTDTERKRERERERESFLLILDREGNRVFAIRVLVLLVDGNDLAGYTYSNFVLFKKKNFFIHFQYLTDVTLV